MALLPNLVDGESVTHDRNGYTINTSAVISDISEALPAIQKIPAALSTLGATIGEPHAVYTNSYLQSVTAHTLSATAVQCDLVYEPMVNVPDEITLTGGLNSVETNLDKDGNAIEVAYTYPATYQGDPAKAGKTETVGKTVQRDIPTLTLTIKRRQIITGNDLITLAATYCGKINAANWTLRPSDAAGIWRCESIDGTWVGYVWSGGQLYYVYDVVMVFKQQEDGYDTNVVFTDNSTGEPPDPDTWTADTSKQIALHDTIDFSPLTA